MYSTLNNSVLSRPVPGLITPSRANTAVGGGQMRQCHALAPVKYYLPPLTPGHVLWGRLCRCASHIHINYSWKSRVGYLMTWCN